MRLVPLGDKVVVKQLEAIETTKSGIVLTGGGALLKNLPEVISEATKVPVFIAQDPLDCVAIGTGEALKNIEVMRRSRK